MHKNKIGVIGDKESILGFKALGISAWPVKHAGEAEAVLQKLAEEDYALVFITENIAKENISLLEKYNASKDSTIIPIPGKSGSFGVGILGIRKAVERAVGADILFKKN